jgi:alkanesulfonate monooxygenase SsuD/methylene tetrahydromethanopterin reductase-like flavin-dependent oxidoreductase (luciferase family)
MGRRGDPDRSCPESSHDADRARTAATNSLLQQRLELRIVAQRIPQRIELQLGHGGAAGNGQSCLQAFDGSVWITAPHQHLRQPEFRGRAQVRVVSKQFERESGPDGAICVGSPETVALKIASTSQRLGLSRFNMKYSNGTLPHDKLLRSIELFGTKVAPRVRELMQQHVAESRSADR